MFAISEVKKAVIRSFACLLLPHVYYFSCFSSYLISLRFSAGFSKVPPGLIEKPP